MTIDAATQGFLEAAAQAGGKPLQDSTPEESRASAPASIAMFGSGPDMDHVDNQELTGHDGGTLDIRVLAPSSAPTGIIVYYHGGGWVTGNIDMFDTLGRQLARRTGATVVLVNYRKAPENPFPTPVEDAWTALNWVDEHRAELASEDAPLIVAGDSAGGNLAAVMARRSRDNDGPTIAAQALIYPVTDNDFDRPSYVAPENQLLLSRPAMLWFWNHYIPEERAELRSGQDASPLQAASLTGLPPTVTLVAGHDPLHDEGVAYAEALKAAGNVVVFREFDDQMHGFFSMVNVLPGAAVALDYIVENLIPYLTTTRTRV